MDFRPPAAQGPLGPCSIQSFLQGGSQQPLRPGQRERPLSAPARLLYPQPPEIKRSALRRTPGASLGGLGRCRARGCIGGGKPTLGDPRAEAALETSSCPPGPWLNIVINFMMGTSLAGLGSLLDCRACRGQRGSGSGPWQSSTSLPWLSVQLQTFRLIKIRLLTFCICG